jgi:membrane protein
MVRKISDYVSFMMIAVIFIIVYSGFTVFASNTIKGFGILNEISPVMGYISPLIIIWIVFSLMFIIMPNTKVNIKGAIFGGIVSGTGFMALQFAYIYFQMGVSKYNAIYGSFAAIPLFLIWLQTSWLIVLFGAELAAAFQNVKSFEFESDTKNMSFFYRRLVSLLIVKNIVDKFKKNESPPSMSDLLMTLKLPVRLASEVIFGLEKAGVIVETIVEESEEKVYLPAFDIHQMTVETIVKKLETYGTSDFLFEEGEDFKKLRNILKSFAERQREMPENVLLIDL